ncbi:hypothetical protein MKA58_17765 [[Clostridium] innocuum]|nr:hypothetical protein [[Clostridium] innocuum]
MESFYDLYVEEVAKSKKLSNELKHAKIENTSLTNRIKYLENTLESSVEKAVNSAIAQVFMKRKSLNLIIKLRIWNLLST